MPLYSYRCECGADFDRYLRLDDYAQPQTCECGAIAQKRLTAPTIVVDIPAYRSPIDGRWINSRAQRREDLARNDCVEYEPTLRAESERRAVQAEEALETAMGETVEAAIHQMPARKREKLVAELENGADVEYARV